MMTNLVDYLKDDIHAAAILTPVFSDKCSSQPCAVLVSPTEPCDTGTRPLHRCSFTSHLHVVLPGTRASDELQGL